MKGRLRIIVRGRVQGVGFRWFVQESAVRFGLTGWVHNNPDGSVELEAEGAREDLSRLEEVLRRGSTYARVDSLEKTDVELNGGKSFAIV